VAVKMLTKEWLKLTAIQQKIKKNKSEETTQIAGPLDTTCGPPVEKQ
jgi:hypothetical protein